MSPRPSRSPRRVRRPAATWPAAARSAATTRTVGGLSHPPAPVAHPSGLRRLLSGLLGVGLLLGGCGAAANGAAGGSGCVAGTAGTHSNVNAPQEPAKAVATPTAACWAKIAPTPLYQTVIGKAPAGVTVTFKTAWSPQDLYIRASVHHWPLRCHNPQNWWDCDALEYYLGPNDKGGAYGSNDVQWGVLSTGVLSQGTNAKGMTGDGFQGLATVRKGKGYVAELIAPFGPIGVTPKKGALVGFTLAGDIPLQGGSVHQGNATVAQMMWAGTDHNYKNDAQWGTITLE